MLAVLSLSFPSLRPSGAWIFISMEQGWLLRPNIADYDSEINLEYKVRSYF